MTMEKMTPLQESIKETIEAHPVLDDKEIAKMVFKTRNPDDTYEGKDPSHAYVSKIRKRLAIMGKPPTFSVEEVEMESRPDEEEAEPGEEPEPSFQEEFEHTDEPEPEEEITFDPVEGFTVDDTEFILTFTFDKFADWTGYEGWRFATDSQGELLDPNEKRFADLTHRMMSKYMPEILDLYFLEFMFCYTGIMIMGGKTKGYLEYRKKKVPPKEVESTIDEEEAPESTEASEIIDAEESPSSTIDERLLQPGEKALGETEFKRRIERRTP